MNRLLYSQKEICASIIHFTVKLVNYLVGSTWLGEGEGVNPKSKKKGGKICTIPFPGRLMIRSTSNLLSLCQINYEYSRQ